MRVFYASNKYWIGCNDTGRIININKNGAKKVASVCRVEIETIKHDWDWERIKVEFSKSQHKE